MSDTNDKKWFEKLRVNSWEIEILIVACILAALFNIPDIMSSKMSAINVSNHFDLRENSEELPLWFMIGFIKILSYNVISSFLIIAKFTFSLYIISRGFWVAVIGLSSVFQDGIDLKKLNYSSYFEKTIPKTRFNDYVLKLDNVCSSIFSLGFLVAFLLLSIFIYLSLLAILMNLLPTNEESILQIIAYSFLFAGFIFFVDILFLGLLKKIKWKPFSYIYSKLYNFLRIVTGFFLYESVYYLFISNVKRRIVLICWLFVLALFMISTLSNKADGYLAFPDVNLWESPINSFMIKHYYEDRLISSKDNFSSNPYPFINSEIISDSYLKLYIPFHPIIHSSLDSACLISQDSTIIKDTVLTLSSASGLDAGINIRANSVYFQKLLHCINSQYAIYIDQDTIVNDFVFYDYAAKINDHNISIKSFFMPIPINKYKEGQHVITIEKLFFERYANEQYKDGEWVSILTKAPDSLIHIPFYIYR